MLKHVLVETRLFGSEDGRPRSQKGLLGLLEALTWWNCLWLEDHPEAPLLYQSGIKYLLPEQFSRAQLPQVDAVRKFLIDKKASEDTLALFDEIAEMTGAGEHFRDFPSLIENGGGDCDNCSCARAAEIRVRLHVPADPYITCRRRADGGMTYHAIVRWPDGSSEDPSLLLGMGGEGKARERAIETAKNEYRRWQCRRVSRGDAIAAVLRAVHPEDRARAMRWFDEPDTFVGQLGPGFGEGIPFLPNYFTDDAFEDFRPGVPLQFWADPQYAGGNIPTSPLLQSSQVPGFMWKADRFDDEDYDRWDDVDGVGFFEIDDEGNLVEPPVHHSIARVYSPRYGRPR